MESSVEFKVDDRIRVVDVSGNNMSAATGTQAIVCPSTRFPKFKKQLTDCLGEDIAIGEFIAVEWVDEPSFTQSNGLYAKYRFELFISPSPLA